MICKIIWTPEAQKDLEYWKATNKAILTRIISLIENIKLDPETGIGKPERLKYMDQNIWSRRIDKKHRIVYIIDPDKVIFIIQCRFHY